MSPNYEFCGLIIHSYGILIEELFEANVVTIEKAISMMYCLFQ
jgi:hypothetical protein